MQRWNGLLIGAVILVALASGCGRSGDEDTGRTPRDATMADYPRVMSATRDRAREMDVLLPLRQAIEAFAALEGRYPRDLQELVNAGYLGALPEARPGRRLRYDPADGSVTLE